MFPLQKFYGIFTTFSACYAMFNAPINCSRLMFLKEEHLMEQTAQYDRNYDEYVRTVTLKRAESYTFFRMVDPAYLYWQH